MRNLTVAIAWTILGLTAAFAQKSLALKDLPQPEKRS
jgi:hypothetical protein